MAFPNLLAIDIGQLFLINIIREDNAKTILTTWAL
jgi:hypothetical protein